jgi:hypothetical protein
MPVFILHRAGKNACRITFGLGFLGLHEIRRESMDGVFLNDFLFLKYKNFVRSVINFVAALGGKNWERDLELPTPEQAAC